MIENNEIELNNNCKENECHIENYKNKIKIEKDLANLNLEESQNDCSSVAQQAKGTQVRQLTDEEIEKLQKDTQLVSEFKHKKFELDAKKNWDLFYRRNKANFFKDRYWTFREFDELNEATSDDQQSDSSQETKTLLEIGCGVGNFIYPLIKLNKKIFVYACDFSTDAIDLLKANPDYDTSRCYGTYETKN